MAKLSKEEKVANQMIAIVQDITLDLVDVGENIADNSSSLLYNRLEVIFDTARGRKEDDYNTIRL